MGGTKIYQRTIAGSPSNPTITAWANIADGGKASTADTAGSHFTDLNS